MPHFSARAQWNTANAKLANEPFEHIFDTKDDAMNAEEVKTYNMKYLNLDEAQYRRHCEFMETPPSQWPASLRQYCSDRSVRFGVSGDALAQWVADWIREGGK